MSETVYILLFIICLIFSAFFSSAETAFISLQRVRLEHMVNSKVPGARIIARMMERPERLLSTILLGNNIVNTAAAAIATAIAISLWGDEGVLIATVVATVLLLVFAETTPKTVATHHSERIAFLYIRPIQFLTWIFRPFVAVLSWIATGIIRLSGQTQGPRLLARPEDIRALISIGHKEGSLEKDEVELLHKALRFGDKIVRDVMVPRTEVVAIEQGASFRDFMAVYAQSPMSRFPVFNGNRDCIVGILSVKDILMAQAKGEIDENSPIDGLVRSAYFTPETKSISDLFFEMRSANYKMAIIIDEFGGTAGIVSLSRLVEEIVGEVGDELTHTEKEFEIINANTFQVDGGLSIDEANEQLDLQIPSGDYYTVAGFILGLLGHIPTHNEKFKYKDKRFTVIAMQGNRIEKVMIIREKPVDRNR